MARLLGARIRCAVRGLHGVQHVGLADFFRQQQRLRIRRDVEQVQHVAVGAGQAITIKMSDDDQWILL